LFSRRQKEIGFRPALYSRPTLFRCVMAEAAGPFRCFAPEHRPQA
jgi:hypothetical protein